MRTRFPPSWVKSPRRVQNLLAALSVAGWACLLVPACIITPPPELEEPIPERPNINVDQVYPPTFQVLNLQRGEEVLFNIPFFSVDAGDRVLGYLYANWGLEGELLAKDNETLLPASAAPEGMGGSGSSERAFSFSWGPTSTLKSGCNQLTFIISHESNHDLSKNRPLDMSEAAQVTWWVNIDADPGQGQTLVDCPVTSAGPLSAGAQ